MKYTSWKFCFIIAGLKIQKNYDVFKLWQPCSTCNIVKYNSKVANQENKTLLKVVFAIF